MLEEIMAWLTGAEATLTAAEGLPDPKEIPNIKALLDDHRFVIQNSLDLATCLFSPFSVMSVKVLWPVCFLLFCSFSVSLRCKL